VALSRPLRYPLGHPDYWDPECYLPQLKVLPKIGPLCSFNLWAHQQVLADVVRRAYAEQKWIVHLKSRRTGSSTFFTGIGYQHASSRRGCRVAILANKKETAQELSDISLRFWSTAPPGLRPRRTKGLKRTLEFPDLDSKMTVHSVKDEEPLRGGAARVVIATEIAFWLDSRASAAWVAARNAVPEYGGLLIAESTPNFEGDPLHRVWAEAHMPDSPWIHVFIPWTAITAYSKTPHHGWVPRQDVREYADRYRLSDTQAYWMQTVGLPKCNNSLAKFKSEYPVNDIECWASGGDPVFDSERLMEMLRDLTGGVDLGDVETTEYVEWGPPEEHRRYVISCDPASSWAEKDYFGVEVFCIDTCEQMAEYLGHSDAHTMARKLIELSGRYNEAMIYVEANGVGDAVLSHLMAQGCRKVFHRPAGHRSHTLLPGWWASTPAKAEAVSILQALIQEGSLNLHSVRAVRQLLAYRGTWDRLSRDTEGGHHDLVAGLGVAAWAWRHTAGSSYKPKRISPDEASAQNWRAAMRLIEAHENAAVGWDTLSRTSRWGVHR
jgi:hypothetical protein